MSLSNRNNNMHLLITNLTQLGEDVKYFIDHYGSLNDTVNVVPMYAKLKFMRVVINNQILQMGKRINALCEGNCASLDFDLKSIKECASLFEGISSGFIRICDLMDADRTEQKLKFPANSKSERHVSFSYAGKKDQVSNKTGDEALHILKQVK